MKKILSEQEKELLWLHYEYSIKLLKYALENSKNELIKLIENDELTTQRLINGNIQKERYEKAYQSLVKAPIAPELPKPQVKKMIEKLSEELMEKWNLENRLNNIEINNKKYAIDDIIFVINQYMIYFNMIMQGIEIQDLYLDTKGKLR